MLDWVTNELYGLEDGKMVKANPMWEQYGVKCRIANAPEVHHYTRTHCCATSTNAHSVWV